MIRTISTGKDRPGREIKGSKTLFVFFLIETYIYVHIPAYIYTSQKYCLH